VKPLIVATGVDGLDARILDVGCGSGQLLRRLAAVGFRRLEGIDPFLDRPRPPTGAVRLRRTTISNLDDGPYDLIMFHHALEHISSHTAVFRDIRRLLSPSGSCLIRMPIVPSDALDRYGAAWVELDAPRHLSLHSVDSCRRLADQASLKIVSVTHEETAFGYWASELYLRDLTLVDAETGRFRRAEDHFSQSELGHFAVRAAAANRDQRAGRAAFLLRPA
jgi:SAM-dependent methyltransferase